MDGSYFYVPCQAKLLSEPLPPGSGIPALDKFVAHLHPMSVLCGPLAPLDRSSVNALHKYGREFARLADRQVQTAVRINTLISYLIDVGTSDLQLTTTMIGGSGFRFHCPDPALATEGTLQRFTLAHPTLQIFVTGYARTVSVIPGENGSLPLVTAEFVLIREQDREAIIHAATLIQQEELRHRAEERAEVRLTGTRPASTTSAFASATAAPSTSMSASPSTATTAIPTETDVRTVSTHTPKTSPIPCSPEERASTGAPGSSSRDITGSCSSSSPGDVAGSCPSPGDVAGSCPSPGNVAVSSSNPGVLTGSGSCAEVVTGSRHGAEAISRTETRTETKLRSAAKPETAPGSEPKPVSETDPGSEAKPITVTGSPSSTGTDPATASATSHGETRP